MSDSALTAPAHIDEAASAPPRSSLRVSGGEVPPAERPVAQAAPSPTPERLAELRRRRAEVVDVLAETILDELFGAPRGPVGPTKRRSREPANV